MNAQFLYDFREKWEFCSGTDLHNFFSAELNGEPSPSGKVKINSSHAKKFVRGCLDSMEHNSPSLKDHCQSARRALAAA